MQSPFTYDATEPVYHDAFPAHPVITLNPRVRASSRVGHPAQLCAAVANCNPADGAKEPQVARSLQQLCREVASKKAIRVTTLLHTGAQL